VNGIDVTFPAGPLTLAGQLFAPDSLSPAGAPGLVYCAGWSGEKYHRAADLARAFTHRGFVVLCFEYRGWGASEGDSTRLIPAEHVVDVRSAVRFLGGRAEVDADRIAVLGTFNGAAVGLQAASEDQSIGAVAGLFPFGNGARIMRALRPYWQWCELLDQVTTDRQRRADGESSRLVDPLEILAPDPVTHRRQLAAMARSPERARWQLSLESAEALLHFSPEESAHKIAPRAVMCVTAEKDMLVPLDEVQALFDRLSEPKRLTVVPRLGHYELYEPSVFGPLLDDIATFLLEHLPAATAVATRV
jgi:uncharacterized protein